MKIKMLAQIAGTRNAQRWPGAGEVVDLPEHEAVDLITQGVAEPVKAAAESATAPAPQTADASKVAKKSPAKKPAKKKA